jgi:beta-glucanase (GH16 family)
MKFWIIAIAGTGFLFGCTKHVSTALDQYQTIAAGNYVMQDAVLINKGWTKIFEENFDTNLDQWDIWTGGGCNNELQYYQPENLQLVNGVLEINAKKEAKTGRTLPSNPVLSNYEFTSGRIESKAKISACTETPRVRILARIRIPTGNGMWPAFWTYGHPWPTQGEIDLLEARGNEPDRY